MKYNNIRAFEKHLEAASPNHFVPIYMILGKDDFQRKQAYSLLVKQLLGDEASNPMSLKVFDEDKFQIEDVLAELNSNSFFSKKQVIVIHQAENLLKPAVEKLLSYYEKPSSTTFLVITASSISGATNFYKKSESAGVILEIPEEKSWEKEKSLVVWIEHKVASLGKKIEPAAAQLLLKQIGTDQATLNQEIEKTACYVGDKPQITIQDIQAICISVNIENVWQLGESIFKRDAATALRISLALIQDGTPLLMLLRQIRNQFQTDFQICTILSNGGTPFDVSKQFAYMKGQILEKHMQFSMNYGLQRFRKGLILIDEMELTAKNSSIEHAYLIERLISKLVA